MKKVVTFTGISNSGKTSLITKLAKILMEKYHKKVLIIKNDPKDKAIVDKEGKDSHIFFNTGANVVITSPNRTTKFTHQHMNITDVIKESYDYFDILLIEGLKHLDYPKIAVFREKVEDDYIEFSDLFVLGKEEFKDNLIGKECLMLNDHEAIIRWIMENGEEL